MNYDPYGEIQISDNRTLDRNGYIEVRGNTLSLEQVRFYFGEELSGRAGIIVEDGVKYGVLCSAGELERSCNSYEGTPLLFQHYANATGDNLPKELIVGSVFNVRMDGTRMVGDVKITDNTIDIQTRNALSCSYSYKLRPKTGTLNGENYQFEMFDLFGGHVALCEKGRAGKEARLQDQSPTIGETKMTNLTDEDKKAVKDLISDAFESFKKEAKDAKDAEEKAAKDAADAEKAEKDAKDAEEKAAKDAAVINNEGKGSDPTFVVPTPSKQGGKSAQDELTEKLAGYKKEINDKLAAQLDAFEACRPYVSRKHALAYDSADEIYKEALKNPAFDVDTAPLSGNALPAVFGTLSKAILARAPQQKAFDSAPTNNAVSEGLKALADRYK